MLWTVRNIVFGILGRTICLGVGIDTEHDKVACLSWPHPVIGFATELTHRLRYGENQSEVVEILINGGIKAVALIEWVDRNTKRLIHFTHRIVEHTLQRVDKESLLAFASLSISVRHES